MPMAQQSEKSQAQYTKRRDKIKKSKIFIKKAE